MSTNATLYRCVANRTSGEVLPGLERALQCRQPASKRTKVAGKFVAICGDHDIRGGRTAEVATAVIAVTDDDLTAAYREVTQDMLDHADRKARSKRWVDNVCDSTQDDLAAAIIDTFVKFRAKDKVTGSNRSVADAFHAALGVTRITLPPAPTPGGALLSGSMTGFGDGFREDILEACDDDKAAILRSWQDSVTTREPRRNGIDATAYAADTMVTVWPEVTSEVSAAAVHYVEMLRLIG